MATGLEMPWFCGRSVASLLEGSDVAEDVTRFAFRMPVREMDEVGEGGVSLGGTIVSGSIAVGDCAVLLPDGACVSVTRIVGPESDLAEARAGDEVTLFADAPPNASIAASTGHVLAAPDDRPNVTDQFAAHVIWTGKDPLLPGRVYRFEMGPQHARVTVSALKHKVDPGTLEHQAAKFLEANEIGYCNLSSERTLVFDSFEASPAMGRFEIIDRLSGERAGVGVIAFALRRATNIAWQALEVDKGARAELKGQRPCVLWFTGLSGAGKSTVANRLEKRLHAAGRHTYVLDGDNVRHGLNKDLGFTDVDRVENIRRIAETAKLFVDAGLIVIVSFISPFRMERRMARDLLEAHEFIEVFVDAPLDVCEARDPKELYKKARAGKIKNFTGIDSGYEPPERADIRLATAEQTADELVDALLADLARRGLL